MARRLGPINRAEAEGDALERHRGGLLLVHNNHGEVVSTLRPQLAAGASR